MMTFNTYLLIDHENIHPSILELKAVHDHVKIFVFARGNERFPLSFYNYVSRRGKFVEIKGTGRNLLDFHIILYIGKFITESKYKYLMSEAEDIESIKNIATTTEIKNVNIDTQDRIYILSKDTDYDGVLKYLYENENFYIKRVGSLDDLPKDVYFNADKLKVSIELKDEVEQCTDIEEKEIAKIATTIQNMTKKPKKVENVINLINDHFNNSLTYNAVVYILKKLIVERKLFRIAENDRIIYLTTEG